MLARHSAPRASALEALANGLIDIIFAVDMFNEGLDIPPIDTVLMLRPTESSIIWLQQFGRGLRKAEGKSTLTVIDYIGNHRSFLVKVRSLLMPLLGMGETDVDDLRSACGCCSKGVQISQRDVTSPTSWRRSTSLQLLLRTRVADEAILAFYEDFHHRHGVRPTAVELYHAGYNPRSLHRAHGSWMKFLQPIGDLTAGERSVVESVGDFLDVVETTPMTKSFKMLTLLAMLNRRCPTRADPHRRSDAGIPSHRSPE